MGKVIKNSKPCSSEKEGTTLKSISRRSGQVSRRTFRLPLCEGIPLTFCRLAFQGIFAKAIIYRAALERC